MGGMRSSLWSFDAEIFVSVGVISPPFFSLRTGEFGKNVTLHYWLCPFVFRLYLLLV